VLNFSSLRQIRNGNKRYRAKAASPVFSLFVLMGPGRVDSFNEVENGVSHGDTFINGQNDNAEGGLKND
jgi:hypothetical protein